MSGYCPDCGNTLCICKEIQAQDRSQSEELMAPQEWPIKYVRSCDMHDKSITRDKMPMVSVGALNWATRQLAAAKEEIARLTKACAQPIAYRPPTEDEQRAFTHRYIEKLRETVAELENLHKNKNEQIIRFSAKLSAMRDALKDLVRRMKFVHADPHYISVFAVSQMKFGDYKGPTYEMEFEVAKQALKQAEEM